MMKITDIVSVTGAEVLFSREGSVDIARLSTDSRSLRKGDIFLALKGENFNGHHFLKEAVKKGASMVIGSEESALRELSGACSVLKVDDTLRALHDIARSYRRSLKAKVIFLTGSNGKSSTKEAIKQALSPSFRMTVTEKNHNNLIGLPKTILSASPDDEILLLEAGTSEKGEIARLCRIAEPDIGILLNIAVAHLDGFGDIEGVLKEKWGMVENLPASAKLLLNGDDPLLASRSSVWHDTEVYGTSCRGWSVQHVSVSMKGTFFTLERSGRITAFFLPVIGEHFIPAALAAVSVAEHFGVCADVVAERLAEWNNIGKRMSVQQWGMCEIINDAYNANPASMCKGLDTVFSIADGTPTCLVLGGMNELGENAKEYHKEVGRFLARGLKKYAAFPWKVLLVGESAGAIQEGAEEEAVLSEGLFQSVPDVQSVRSVLKEFCKGGGRKRVYLKASNGVGLHALDLSSEMVAKQEACC